MPQAITTVSGKFYEGMTRAEAQKKGLAEKTFWQKMELISFHKKSIFDDIDLNKNGVLEKNEILAERDVEAKRKKDKRKSLMLGGAGLCMTVPLIASTPLALGVTAVGIVASLYGLFSDDGSNDKKQTEHYRMQDEK